MNPISVEVLFVLLSGLAFGSFVSLVSYRLPRREDIVIKPSRCPQCNTTLTIFDLWPVLSWVLSGRRCRHCKAPVSIRYPLTEIATAAGFLLVYMKFGMTPLALVLAMAWVALMVMIVVDIEHYLIPDAIQITLVVLAVAYHIMQETSLITVVGGGLLGEMIGLSLHHGYRWLRKKEGLGFGDVKFLAVAGLWLGLKPMVPFLFFSGLFGVATGLVWRLLGKGPIFPFGPSLALAMFLCIVMPEFPNFFWNIGQLAR